VGESEVLVNLAKKQRQCVFPENERSSCKGLGVSHL